MKNVKTTHLLLLAMGTLLAFAGGSALLNPSGQQDDAKPFTPAQLAAHKDAVANAGPINQFDPVEAVRHQLTQTWPGVYTVSYDMSGQATSPKATDQLMWSLSATMTLVKLGTGDELVGRLSDVVMSANAPTKALLKLDPSRLNEQCSSPFILHAKSSNTPLAHQFDKHMPSAVRNVLDSTMQAADLSGHDSGKSSWTRQHVVSTHPVTVAYSKIGQREYMKQWEVKADGELPGKASGAHITSSRTTKVSLDPQQHLSRLDSRHHSELKLVVQQFEQSTRSRIMLTRIAEAPEEPPAWAKSLSRQNLEGFITAPKTRLNTSTLTLDHSSAETLERIEQAMAQKDYITKRKLMMQLQEHVRREPELAKRFDDELRAADERSVDFDARTRVEALMGARTPEAEQMMADLIKDEHVAGYVRNMAAISAVLMTNLSPQIIDSLRQASQKGISEKSSRVALLSLSGQVRTQTRASEAGHEELAEEIIVRARQALLQQERPLGAWEIRAWLRVLGNVGERRTWSTIAPFVDHESMVVQRAALNALRFVDTIDARQVIAHAIIHHQDPDVREAAISAAGYHKQAAMEPYVIKALEEDRDVDVRAKAANQLAAWGMKSPILYEHIARAARKETDSSVKKMLEGYAPEIQEGSDFTLLESKETRRPKTNTPGVQQ